MRLLFLDLETTGLDFDDDYITEIGYVIKDTEISKPLLTVGEMLKVPGEVPQIITEITGITKEILNEFGEDPKEILEMFLSAVERYKIDYIVAHNGNGFDKPMLEGNLNRLDLRMPDIEWLDTRLDIVYPEHFKVRNLTYLCAEHGFINPFPHAALFDAMATAKLFSHYDADEVVAYMKMPNLIVRAMVTYEQKDKAKEQSFKWQEAGGTVYTKQWVKQIKENELEALKDKCDFKVVVIA